MTKEEKQLLLIDLCSRLPYGVKVQYKGNVYDMENMYKNGRAYLGSYNSIYGDWHCSLEFEDYPKPYLRPLSSMTEEEFDDMFKQIYQAQEEFFRNCSNIDTIGKIIANDMVKYDWLNKNKFDYRGLIEKGLAIEVTRENNPYKD